MIDSLRLAARCTIGIWLLIQATFKYLLPILAIPCGVIMMFSFTRANVLSMVGALTLLPPTSLLGQVPPFQHYTTRDGLISNGVNSIVQDSQERLWIGTAEGINVYNGYEFTTYRTPDGLAQDYVTCLASSRITPGLMWVGTLGNGISRFHEGRFTTLSPDTGSASNIITALMEDDSGTLWCGTRNGLYILSDPKESSLKRISVGNVEDIIQVANRDVWVAMDESIMVFPAREESVSEDHARRLRESHIVGMFADADGSVWLAGQDGKLMHYRETELLARRSLPVGSVNSIIEDTEGIIWACTDSGLCEISKHQFESGSIQRYTMTSGLAANSIKAGYVDHEGNVWFGAAWAGAGLLKLSHRNLTIIPIGKLPLGLFYQSALTVSRGRVWGISVGGIVELWRDEQNHWVKRFHANPELHIAGMAVAVQSVPHGGIAIQDSDGTVYKYIERVSRGGETQLELVRSYRAQSYFPGHHSLAFLPDEKGNIWLSVSGVGIIAIGDEGRLMKLLPLHELPSFDIRAMYVDRGGTVWFGGVDGGVAFLRHGDFNERLQYLKSGDGLPDERIRSIGQDSKGRMLFGTRFSGLAVYDGHHFTTVSIRDGLTSNCVWSVSVDSSGHIWSGTQMGLQGIDESTLQPLPMIKGFADEGVISCRITDGTVIGYRYGSLILYNTTMRDTNPASLPIYITHLETNGRRADLNGRLEFAFDRNSCTIGFVGISFKEENKLQYRYRMLGIDDEWSKVTTERAVTLAELPPRTYTFEVKAISSDGAESRKPAILTFSILPPPWRTWWAYTTYVLCTLVAVAGWRRYEIRKIRGRERAEAAVREARLHAELEKQRTRMQIARDLHDEVGSTLSSISLFAQAVKKSSKDDNTSRFISLISESSSHAKEAMSDIIWSIDPSNDSWKTIVAKLQRYASDLFESRGILHTIEIPSLVPEIQIDPQRRRHFWLLFKEIVANVANHSKCTRVDIKLSVEEGTVHLSVRDNGIGFDPAADFHGNGVRNIRSRAGMIAATAQVYSSPDQGTEWVITFTV